MKKLLLIPFLVLLLQSVVVAQTKFGRITAHPLDSVTSILLATPALADIDNDGDLDIFIGQQGLNQMKYYENTGTASVPVFEEKIDAENPLDVYGNNNGCNAPTLVDIDTDGDLDAFVGIWANTIKYYENTGDKNTPDFVARAGEDNPLDLVSMPDNCVYPAFMDMDADNDLDAIVSDKVGNISYFENTGTSVAPVFTENTTDNPLSDLGYSSRIKIVFHDVDGDGLHDAVISNDLDNSVSVYENTGSLQSPVFSLVSPENNPFSEVVGLNGAAPQLGDLNNDGHVELVLGVSYRVYVFSEYVYLPDENFKVALLENTSINTVDDGGISFEEAAAFLGIINVADMGIEDLTGIEAFVNLSQLKISGNKLSSLDLTANTNLNSLTALNCGIDTINLTGLTELSYLNLTSSNLTSIDLSTLGALETLTLTNNKLTSIDVSNNTKLSTLSVPLMELTEIDVSNLPELKTLYFQINKISSVDLSNNPLLKNLDVGGNLLTELDLSMNTKLELVSADANLIENLDLSANIDLLKVEVRNNPNLEFLNVKNGFNSNFTFFQANNSPNLSCIMVDDTSYSKTNWTQVDDDVKFRTSCGVTNVASEINLLSAVYPNPVSDALHLEANVSGSFVIKNIFGQTVFSGLLVNGINRIAVGDLLAGIYFITSNGYSQEFVKE